MTPHEASQKYHWVVYNSKTNTIELYMDHYMLSGARLCEAKFVLDHLLWVKPRYSSDLRKPWFLDFGEYIHYCTEIFYNHFKKTGQPPVVDSWLDVCKMKWAMMRMDEYKDYRVKADADKYDDIGGWEGVVGLLIEYYAYYMSLRVRVVDTEITFGHNKEVFLGEWMAPIKVELPSVFKRWGKPKLQETICFIKCYLTGRIDLLIDNGYKVGPVDHKTTHKFDGYEHLDFNPHDGITGYILAINQLLKRYREEGLTNIPICNDGWIYHISSCRPSTPRDKTKKPGPRFKATPIGKTEQQLEDYKQRQLSTFKRIAELLFNNKIPEWNTITCNNIFYRPCEYKIIHEQPSDQWVKIINDHFTISTPWDTRNHANKISGPDTKGNSEKTISEEVKSEEVKATA